MRVLIVAYYFPPKGGAGTQRFAKFAKYLPEHGIEPVVVTAAAATSSEHAPHDDASLQYGDCQVERVATPARSSRWQRLRRKLRLHVDDDEWADAAAERAMQLATEQRFDAVITTLSPYACARIGARLQRDRGLPWIADLRDPWALDGWRVYPSPVHAGLDLRRLRAVLREADCVIANVPEARRAFVEQGAEPSRCVVIPNGYDEDDFAAGRPRAGRGGEPMRLVHVGTFHPASLPAGMTANRLRRVRHRQIAPLGRTGYYLLHAIAALRQRLGDAELGRRLRLHLYGSLDESHRQLMAELGIAGLVEQHGYVPHARSVAALLDADASFVPLHDVPPGERALVVPGKVYEAVASERTVIGAVPPGDAADLIRGLGAGHVVAPTDVEGLAAVLEDLSSRHLAGAALPFCARGDFGAFSRRALTARLARVLKAAVEGDAPRGLGELWPALESA